MGSTLLHFLLMENTLSLGLMTNTIRVWMFERPPLHLGLWRDILMGPLCCIFSDGKLTFSGSS